MACNARVVLISLLLSLSAPLSAESPAPGDLRSAGAVDFPISCKPDVQADFVRGVALLHSFFYEEARDLFTSVAERDPACAIAHWGVAMTLWHPIWTAPNPEEMSAGRAAAERAMKLQATPRERGFIEAINAYYTTSDAPMSTPVGQTCHGPIGATGRVAAYQRAMQRHYEKFPKDFETRVFHAFALLSVGYSIPTDTTLTYQKAAGKLLEKLWKENPQHPGVTHYIIHSYDYPSLARQGLPAAKAYADIAPWVPHALHMPSHIFTRLGMWDESVETNQASAEASRAHAAQKKRTAAEVEELHALDYMMYSYLQEGRDAQAREVLESVSSIKATFPELDFVGAYAMASVPARYALERNAWDEAAALKIPERAQWQRYPFVEALFEYSHALGSLHAGDKDTARKAIERMQSLHTATTEPKYDYFKKQLDLQIKAASAWLAHAEGRDDEAVAALRAAADAEDALGKAPVSPGALVPAREQLGELLLALKRPKEALAAYEAALKIYPGRFNALYGAADAAEHAGDKKRARKYFAALLKQVPADSPRKELARAKAAIA